ncbi:glycine betaine ABC transporter substrate-binding protein [Rubrobacter indicoceani]|uniref:glycine betaine ABC transporter substrate-binding protein n=1 Tax=Rubrobacter indicoceani TaxID=2051957 RepID=UPI000E5B9BFB|nr:glycine betaine ABC transporter substrate-binding protein [Rubrobacter indicoceani]
MSVGKAVRAGLIASVAALFGVLVAGCGGQDRGSIAEEYRIGGTQQTVRLAVGSKDFTEQEILGEITLQALRAAGAETIDRTGTGDTEAVRRALVSGEIDMYWEYTGTGWLVHLARPDPIADPEEQYVAVRDADLEGNGIVWLPQAPANNTYALATRADEFGDVQNISDLEGLFTQGDTTLCVGPEFGQRADGLPGMEDHYGFDFPEESVSVLSDSTVYGALEEGSRCDFGSVFATDGRVDASGLRLLEDDGGFFAAYNPSLNMTSETLELYPELENLFADIAVGLDTATLRELSAAVDVDGQTPEQVAGDWLAGEGYTAE